MIRVCLALVVPCIAVLGCSSKGLRENFEYQLNLKIGKLTQEIFYANSPVKCFLKDGEYGCLYSDERKCQIWYTVDQRSSRVLSWQYKGDSNNCGHYGGA